MFQKKPASHALAMRLLDDYQHSCTREQFGNIDPKSNVIKQLFYCVFRHFTAREIDFIINSIP